MHQVHQPTENQLANLFQIASLEQIENSNQLWTPFKIKYICKTAGAT